MTTAAWSPRNKADLADTPEVLSGTSARTLAARFGEVVNVRDFGAIGDGITDDTAALQAACAAACAAAPATLYLPPGLYLTSQALRPEADDLVLSGHGATLRLTADDALILVSKGGGSPPEPVRRLRILGLRLDTQSHGMGSVGVVQLNNCLDFLVDSCTIRGTGNATSDGFVASQGSTGKYVGCMVDGVNKSGYYQSTGCGFTQFIACTARHVRGATGAVGFLAGLGGCTLSACEADDCAGAAVMLNAIGAAGSYPAQAPAGVTIQGGRFTNSLYGILMDSVIPGVVPTDIRVLGAAFERNTYHGIAIAHGARVALIGNTYQGNGLAGVQAGAGAAHIQIEGGHFRNNGASLAPGIGMGIYLQGCAHVQILGGTYSDDQVTQTQYYAVIFDLGAGGEVCDSIRILRPDAVAPVLPKGSLTATAPTNSAIDLTAASTRSAATPDTGTNQVGDIVWNSVPASGQPVGWVCTVAGTPGTFAAFGSIA